jgi:hypothetical protein
VEPPTTADRILTVAHMPGLSHGSFRLYVILSGIAQQKNATDDYFAITLQEVVEAHPGISGRSAGATTVIKQVAELRRNSLVTLRAALHRNEPELPVLMKVLYPNGSDIWHHSAGASSELDE